MSYTTLYAVPEAGPIVPAAELQNSVRGAAMLWDWLGREHVPGWQDAIFAIGDDKLMQKVWDLAGNTSIPRYQRIALATTFDNAMVRRCDFSAVASAFDTVAKTMTAMAPSGDQDGGNFAEHADAIRALGKAAVAICWDQTSVSDYGWRRHDQCTCCGQDLEEPRMFDLSRDSGHRWVLEQYRLSHRRQTS